MFPDFTHESTQLQNRILDTESLEPGLRTLVEAILDRRDLPERLARLALTFRKQRDRNDSLTLAGAARAMSPHDPLVQALTDWVVRRHVPLWHFRIVHDEQRNRAYADALRQFVKPGMTVFEIGTGTGLLAMLAAQAGARHVYTCEVEPPVAEAAREIIARNGFADRITVIEKDAMQIRIGQDLPERADLFVAEIVDNNLLGEQILQLTEFARARLLKPDAILLPHTVVAMGMVVRGSGSQQTCRMATVMGFDLSPFNRFSPQTVNAGLGGGDFDALSDCRELFAFDLTRDQPKMEESRKVSLMCTHSGVADGVLRWHRLDFGEGIVFENRPPQTSCWCPQLHLFRQPRTLVHGEEVSISFYHDRERLIIL